MKLTVEYSGKTYHANLKSAYDLSIPLRAGKENVNAFYIPPMEIEPFRAGTFVGAIEAGGSCNVFDIKFNPHGNGTHTETVGHISTDKFPIYKQLTEYFFVARVISIKPVRLENDYVILPEQIENAIGSDWPEALIIRTLPNESDKINFQYSGTNPVYLEAGAAALISKYNVKHLLVDFPSVDREEDGGKLLAHKAFWNFPHAIRSEATITEMIYVKNEIADGWYLLNLQTASFDNDASPSKPIIFPLNV